MSPPFTRKVREIILRIPPGKVITYGFVAAAAGSGSGARQVARILHSSARKYGLPWHRVVNRQGRISLPPSGGYERQRDLLLAEGVRFRADNTIDLDRFLWLPDLADIAIDQNEASDPLTSPPHFPIHDENSRPEKRYGDPPHSRNAGGDDDGRGGRRRLR